MMQQQQPQQQQQRRHKRTRLAAAFALASRGQSLEDQSAFVPAEITPTTATTTTKQACPLPSSSSSSPTATEDQQQHHQGEEETTTKHEAIQFLEEHGVPTFVPVFETTESIEPKCNESLRGQVPWKCAFCHSHSFGHHCMGCSRHRDAAALRIFVGQLCKEGTQQVVQKMVEVLCPKLTAPCIFVEPHTDANTGRGKGCAWIYVHALEDIPYVVKSLNKRTFVTVDENSGNVGFVAFPTSFSNHEIEEAFQIDHDAQTEELQALFLYTCIAAQVPKAFHSWGLLGKSSTTSGNKNHMNNNNGRQHQHQQRQHQHATSKQMMNLTKNFVNMPPPAPPTYGSSLPPPPAFTPVIKQQQQHQQFIDNRQFEEQEMRHQQMLLKKPSSSTATVSVTPKVFLGNEPNTTSTSTVPPPPQHFTAPTTQQQVVGASWVNNTQDDDNYFVHQQQQYHRRQQQPQQPRQQQMVMVQQQQQQTRYHHHPY